MKEKLERVRPRTIAQASRIPGVTHAAVSLVMFISRSKRGDTGRRHRSRPQTDEAQEVYGLCAFGQPFYVSIRPERETTCSGLSLRITTSTAPRTTTMAAIISGGMYSLSSRAPSMVATSGTTRSMVPNW